MWIGEFLLQKAKEVNDPDAMIFNFTMENLRKEFAAAGKGLGVDQLHPYQLRHGGASEDLSSGFRDHNSVKARGRWKTDQSVRRYAKIGKGAAAPYETQPTEPPVFAFGRNEIWRKFSGVMSRQEVCDWAG